MNSFLFLQNLIESMVEGVSVYNISIVLTYFEFFNDLTINFEELWNDYITK